MANVKQYLEIISAECDECGGAGFYSLEMKTIMM